MAKKTAVLVANPIQDAIDILNTDGWVKGEFRCEEGSRCAVGALRAAYGMFENDNQWVLKTGISNEDWAQILSLGEDVEADTVVYDEDSYNEETRQYENILFDMSEMVDPIDPQVFARYQEAVTVLADTLVPGWGEDIVMMRQAHRELMLNAGYYTAESVDNAAPWLDLAKVRAVVENAENAVIQFNDSRVNDIEGRDEVLAGFQKAAKKLAKAKKREALSV